MSETSTHSDTLVPLAQTIGDFIRYWGFRRIHGQIWTLLYLKKAPINLTAIAETLQVSKSLVTTATKELEDFELIQPVELDENRKTKYFTATPDFLSIVQKTLKLRELVLIEEAERKIGDLLHETAKGSGEIDTNRLKQLMKWSKIARTSVRFFSEIKDIERMASFIR